MRISMLVGVALTLALGATAAQAQIGGFPGGRGGFPGGRGGMGRGGRGGPRYGGAPRVVVPDLSNPVRLILASKDSLRLTPDEVQNVDSVAKALDRQNDTLIAQVHRAFGDDSASMASGQGGRRAGGDGPPDDVALRDRLNVLKPTFEAIKKNDDQAWKSATALLTRDQRKQADRIRKDDQKAREQERNRWNRRRGPEGDGGY